MSKPEQVSAHKPKPAGEDTLTLTAKDRLSTWQRRALLKHWRAVVSATCTIVAAGAVALELGIVNLWERQVQSLFFEIRGPVEAPGDIVILAIDEESLSQGQYYRENPERYESLKPIESWPWQRRAYAQVIERIMDAGARAVAVDVLFTETSAYGPADDDAFTEVLGRYGDRIVLAADYSSDIRRQGVLSEPMFPLEQFEEAGVLIGSINFHLEPNRQIHRLGQVFLAELAAEEADFFGASAVTLDEVMEEPLSFAQATLKAARRPFSADPQENIFFFGPQNTFEQLPFWYVLDDDPWHNYLNSGDFFKDKIVIIGTTAAVRQDFHNTPFARMAGVEILANTVATLDQDVALKPLIRRPIVNALVVLGLGLLVMGLATQTRRQSRRAMIIGGGLSLWGVVSYFAFAGAQTILITGTPMLAIATMGLMDFGLGFTAERLKRKRLRTALERYATSPVVQEIISQQDDFQDLLEISRAEIVGSLLRDRYRILEVLGAGGFGETYMAQDTLRPGDPICVVKQLKIVSDNPKSHHLARRLFEAEAVVLGNLGEHSQIPQLLAYFEVQQTFYLVQEMVEGKLLRNILSRSRPLSQRAVVNMLRDLLPVVSFVHSQGVIHRDIKPSNIILRKRDRRYVLIDFGAVKTISNKLSEDANTRITSTVGIGTQGYMPSEQSAGMPTVRSDIYALGITAIEALTGRPPHALKRSESGEVIWSHRLENLSPELCRIINKMVRYDFNNRYASSEQVLADLQMLDDERLSNDSTVQEMYPDPDFPSLSERTYNQGTRPGVIATNPELGETQILPEHWPNELETRQEPTSEPNAAEDGEI
ncbi:MAG: serine/threonine-protein kinase [Cyanobacteria bacterium J06623_5]